MVVIPLIEEPGTAVIVLEQMRVSGLAVIPGTGISVGQKGLIGQSFPFDTIRAFGDADLLRVVVIGAGIEHVQGIPLPHDRGPFHALTFPRILRFQDRCIGELCPLVAVEIRVQWGRCHALHLDLVGRVAGSEIEEIAVSEGEYFCIDGTATVPVAGRAEDRVGWIAFEVDPIVGDGVADGILRSVPVGLIEEVDLFPNDDGAGSSETILLRLCGRCDLTDLVPAHEITAFGDADAESLHRVVLILVCGQGVIHQVSAAEFHDVRIFGKGNALARGIAEHHGGLLGMQADG